MKPLLILAVCIGGIGSSRADRIVIRKGSYAAIAYSPATGTYRTATNYNSRTAAETAAKTALGTADAKIVCWVTEGFCALALGDAKSVYGTGWRFGAGASNTDAMTEALKNCNERTTNARIVVCVSSDGKYVHEPARQPEKKDNGPPKPGAKDPTALAIGDEVIVPFMLGTQKGKVVGFVPASDSVTVEIDFLGQVTKQAVLRKDIRRVNANPGTPADPKAAEPLKPLPPGTFVRALLTERDPNAAIGAIAFSDDGRTVAVDHGDNTIRLHNVADGKPTGIRIERKEFQESIGNKPLANGALIGFAFTQKGKSLTIVSEGTVQVADISGRGPNTLLSSNTTINRGRKHVAFAVRPDGASVAVASTRPDGFEAIFFYDPAAKGPPARTTWIGLKLITTTVNAMAYSPDGKKLAIVGVASLGSELKSRMIEVWDVASQKNIGTTAPKDSDERFAAFAPDGKSLVTGRTIRDISVQNGGTRLLFTSVVPTAVVYDPKGKWIATGGADRRLVFWNPATGEKLACLRAADRRIEGLAVSHDGATIATSGSYLPWEESETTLLDVAAILKAAPKEDAMTKLAALPNAKAAFDFGILWANEMFDSLRKEMPRKPGKDVENLAKSLAVVVPAYPPAPATVGEFLKPFRIQGATFAGEIRRRHGAGQERLFTLAVQLSLIGKFYRPAEDVKKVPAVDSFRRVVEKCCRELEFPEATYRRLAARIAANAPANQVGHEVYQLGSEIRALLAAEPAKNGK